MSPHPPWQALADGQPLQALRWWRAALLAQPHTIAPYLQAAEAGLAGDPLQAERRQALALLAALAGGEPGPHEVERLGALLLAWGDQCLSIAPTAAQQHYERAWACGRDAGLRQRLANLYARQGLSRGAHALAPPQHPLPPWPQPPCAGLHCQPCIEQLDEAALSDQAGSTSSEPELQVHELSGGRAWIELNPRFRETMGVAVADAAGALQPHLCRRYPGHWPHCPHRSRLLQHSLDQLAWQLPAPLLQLDQPVLAVADLSAELYYHGQLELLPRLGRSWMQLARQFPGLRLWHNGGRSRWLQEALQQLGIPADRLICAHRYPQLLAQTLLVPSFPSPFGVPGPRSLQWLRSFWGAAVAALPAGKPPRPSRGRGVFLQRPLQQRRPLLQHELWRQHLAQNGVAPLPARLGVAEQLQALQSADQVVAAHGGAMANLLLLPPDARVLELANPAYAPPYFASLMATGGLRHQRQLAAATPAVLQDLLYIGPLEWPIDAPPPSPA